ncbi:Acyl-CoA N-acyltransferase [Penicillium sp. IBT 31633x]|nr:Acyl-CoA N-acyltransferase [Penicillium sp. IBT 31633x]
MARVVTSPHVRDNATPRRPRNNAVTVTDQTPARDASPEPKRRLVEKFESPGQSTDVATEDFQIVAALKLIASSVAQQRQIAAKQLISHPITLALVAVVLGCSINIIYHDQSNWLYILVTCAIALSTGLSIVKRLVDGYIDEAEMVGTLNWLYGHDPCRGNGSIAEQTDPEFNSDNGFTFVLVHRFKRRIIGALVISIVPNDTEPDQEVILTGFPKNKNYTPFIRAWTVQQEFRGYGIGADILNEAVKICYEKGWQAPRFASSHANSVRMLYPTFHRDMDHASAMWSSYLRKRVEAHRQSNETRVLEASSNTIDDRNPTVEANVLLNRMKVAVDLVLRHYLNSNLEKAMVAQSRWKEML